MLAALTLASRLTGLLRDIVIGSLFGASAAADAFFVAFRIPNLFRRVVAEGTASSAIVPVLAWYRERQGAAATLRAAGALGVATAVVLGAVSLAGSWFSGPIVSTFAPGFDADSSRYALAVRLTAMVFPYLGLIGMAAWAMGVLHSFQRFAVPACGPILFNVAVVAAALGLSRQLPTPVYALAVGVVAGGMLQFLVQVPGLRSLGLRSSDLTPSHPAVRRVGALLIPTMLGGAVYQMNILVSTVLGSMLPVRSISYLWYADRLLEFPLGIVAVTVGTALLPTLATHASASRHVEMSAGAEHALKLVWSLCVPATVGLWMLAPCVVRALFERGQFTGIDTDMTADALKAFAVGLFGVGSARVLVAVFYALERPVVPVVTGLIALIANVVCGLMTMGPVGAAASRMSGIISQLSARLSVADWGHVGLAFGTSAAATLHAVLLFLFARRALGAVGTGSLAKSFGQHAAAAVIMALFLYGWRCVVAALAISEFGYLELWGGLLIGGSTYLLACLAFGSEEIRDFVASLRHA